MRSVMVPLLFVSLTLGVTGPEAHSASSGFVTEPPSKPSPTPTPTSQPELLPVWTLFPDFVEMKGSEAYNPRFYPQEPIRPEGKDTEKPIVLVP